MFTFNSFGLLVCGSRGFLDYQLFSEKLDFLLSDVEQWDIHIITGDADGVDSMARRYAQERGMELHAFYANWNEYGRSAGMKRNQSMFRYLIENFTHPACFAMWDGQSVGTKNSIGLAKYWGIPLRVFTPKPEPLPARQKEAPVFVSAPKWFQDDPDISNYDKFLIRHRYENVPKNRDWRDEARDRTVFVDPEDTPKAKRRRREALLERAARLATIYGVWADEEVLPERPSDYSWKQTPLYNYC